jgi:hypothetical protein
MICSYTGHTHTHEQAEFEMAAARISSLMLARSSLHDSPAGDHHVGQHKDVGLVLELLPRLGAAHRAALCHTVMLTG